MVDQHIKEYAYLLDPQCWQSYSGFHIEVKQEMERRRNHSLSLADQLWIRNPDELLDRITCMCGDSLHNHASPFDAGHNPVSRWDYEREICPYPGAIMAHNQGESTMSLNLSKAVFLLNKNVRAIGVVYEYTDAVRAKAERLKQYAFKSLDKDMKVGDVVVIPTTNREGGMTIGVVTEVDVPVDYDAHDFQMAWIIDKVDTDYIASIKKMEADAVEEIKRAQDRKRRKELGEAILDERSATNLAITHEGNGGSDAGADAPQE